MAEIKSKRSFSFLLPIVAGSAMAAAAFFLFHALREYHYSDIAEKLKSYSGSTILVAVALTALNYLVLSFYDALALGYVGEKLPYRKTVFASFLSYVFSYNIGLSIFGSSALRFRFYSAWGIENGKIARIVAFCVATFWIGLAAAGGVALVTAPHSGVSAFSLSGRTLGALLVLAVVIYLAASFSGKVALTFRNFRVALPSARTAVVQVLVASVDWCLAAFILYLLLPAGRPPFSHFLSVYMIAQLAAATSHVPGGVGVLESVIVVSLSGSLSPADLFGAILAYRAVYYLLPLVTAIVIFSVREVWLGRKKAAGIALAAMPYVPALAAAAVFIAGTVLLLSSATPSLQHRLTMLASLLPFALIEGSHFAASLVGLALILVADAMRRRVDAAYYVSLALIAAGIALSILKGFDWEEALILSAVFLLLLPTRKQFFRRAVLFSKPTEPWPLLAAGMALAASAWIGFFAYKHVEYRTELWWQFELSHNAPRFLRAGLGVSLAAAVVALRMLFGHRPMLPRETLTDCEADILRILETSERGDSSLSLLGDKRFFFGSERKSFLMYAMIGKTCVVMGDPVGDKTEFQGLIWDFYELVRRQGARIVWYEISSANLPLFVELGLKVLKIGEEAIVGLDEFSLAGSAGKKLRPLCNKIEKDGYIHRVMPPEETRSRLQDLRPISDWWLSEKKAKEKGFSLGYFSEDYLARTPCSVVEKDGKIVAFSNVWTSGDGKEASIDLMRYGEEAPKGTMEYLFVRTIEWAKRENYRNFNLGMAPFSGLETRSGAPFWNKAISLIFRSGEGLYNFQGLRAFKSKFHPDWQPRYIASSGGLSFAGAAADIVMLISKGKPQNPEALAQPSNA